MRKILVAIFLTLALQTAWAIDIGPAKDLHLVGEANNGLLAPLKTPVSAEVQALIDRVNRKRKAEFAKAAARTGATVAQVRHRFYELAVQRTKTGHSYQDLRGNWTTKQGRPEE